MIVIDSKTYKYINKLFYNNTTIRQFKEKGDLMSELKRLNITISDFIFNSYIKPYKNKSRRIESLIIIGGDIEAGDWETTKQRNFQLLQENRNLIEENKKLKATIGRYKNTDAQNYIDDPDLRKKEMIADGLKANNPLRDDF